MPGGSPQVNLWAMSVLFIECKTFLADFPDWEFEVKCCRECHTNDALIYVRPFKETYPADKNADWGLCIEGMVCCKLYDKVRALPREWWLRKAKAHGVYRSDSRGYIYSDSTSRNTEKPSGQRPKVRESKRAARERDEDDGRSGGLSSFLNRRR